MSTIELLEHLEVPLGEQQDASEFMSSLLDKLGDEDTSVGDQFRGKLRHTVTCNTCRSESHTTEEFLQLHLPINQTAKSTSCKHTCSPAYVQESYTRYAELRIASMVTQVIENVENLRGKDAFSCDRCCGRNPARRSTVLMSPPAHLILSLNRFQYVGNKQIKILTPVRVYNLLAHGCARTTSVCRSSLTIGCR